MPKLIGHTDPAIREHTSVVNGVAVDTHSDGSIHIRGANQWSVGLRIEPDEVDDLMVALDQALGMRKWPR